jgi:hypothetical protein
MILDTGSESPFGVIGASIDEQANEKNRRRTMDEKEIAKIIPHMDVEIGGDPYIVVKFNEGILKGNTIKFWGDRISVGIVLGLSSGRIIVPVEGKRLPEEIRKLTVEEREYVKTAVLAYLKAGYEKGTIKRTVTFAEK